MTKGKRKPDGSITQLKLFKEEQPAETGQVEEQAGIKQTKQLVEDAPPKKRVRNKKNKDQEIHSAISEPEPPGEPVIVNVSLTSEEDVVPPKPADAKQTEENETRQKEKYKKIQEERPAALRKARGAK